MNNTQLSEKKAWLFIADCFEKYAKGEIKRPEYYSSRLEERIIRNGLCFAFHELWQNHQQITDSIFSSMRQKINEELNSRPDDECCKIGYLAYYGIENAQFRADIARKFAGLCI